MASVVKKVDSAIHPSNNWALNFMPGGKDNISRVSERVRDCSCHENINFISSS